VSRLEFAPGTDAMEVTEIERGRFVFPPRAGVAVSRALLDETITDAGYEIEIARAEIRGTLEGDSVLLAGVTGQRFRLEWAEGVEPPTPGGAPVTVFGVWTAGAGGEAIRVERIAGDPHPG